MPAAADRIEFAPPVQPGRVRALALAVVAHLLLMLALTWGISWNRESDNVAAEAELWSRVPQQAAPPPAAPPVTPAPAPAPPPEPAQKVEPTPAPAPAPSQADIALQREKEEARQKQAELERRQQLEARKEREELEKKKLQAREKREELEREKKLEARKQEEALKRQQLAEKKAAEDRKKEEQAKAAKAKARQQEEDRKLAALRDEQMRRIKGLAGATGGAAATGTAQRSAGPSDSYGGRIRARVRPNIVFTDDIAGNPTAEVEVQMAPDGTITSRRLVRSSGVRSWDDAVLRALDRTETLPRDVDGRVHSPLLLAFRPKD